MFSIFGLCFYFIILNCRLVLAFRQIRNRLYNFWNELSKSSKTDITNKCHNRARTQNIKHLRHRPTITSKNNILALHVYTCFTRLFHFQAFILVHFEFLWLIPLSPPFTMLRTSYSAKIWSGIVATTLFYGGRGEQIQSLKNFCTRL